MKQTSKRMSWKNRALVFGLLPCALGIGVAWTVRSTDTVWLTDAGVVWPFVLTVVSAAIIAKLVVSPFEERSSAIAAWLTLWLSWFYVPIWTTAVEVPYSAAVISRDGRVHLVSDELRYRDSKVWHLTHGADIRVIHRVAGKVTASLLEIEYRYAKPYIGTRRHGEDLAASLTAAAEGVLDLKVLATRTSRIALLDNRIVQDGVLARICSAVVGQGAACPIKMSLSPLKDETVPGAAWSTLYTESEAIAERHLPTLVQLLTMPDSPLVRRDEALGLLLDLADTVAPLSQVAQRPHLLDDERFDELIRRILSAPGCDDSVIPLVVRSSRLSREQRRALRAKALSEARIATLIENASTLRITDSELGQLTPRMQLALLADAAVAVRAFQVFGERLSPEAQRDAVAGIVSARASYALSALEHVNFSPEIRRDLVRKILADAATADFSSARLSKERLQEVLTPAEMRALVGTAVKRSDASEKWLEFTLASLSVRDMTPAERQSILNELLFKSSKDALEFVSKHRNHLDPAEVNEVTRGYARTLTPGFCLHLSHRNKNRRTEYFSEDQLQIFRDCANAK
jgi:hypothetical protein